MRLTDLEPRWYALNGRRIGLTFNCPHCLTQRLGVPFHQRGHETMEDGYILANHGATDAQHIWTLGGQHDFNTITLSPSIDASASGHWHGFITNGEVT
jgi:Family of unknown function (DUF6527)